MKGHVSNGAVTRPTYKQKGSGAQDQRETPRKRRSGSSVDTEAVQQTPWSALFYFTTKSHIASLVIGLTTAVIGGVASPAQSLLLGKAFGLFTSYASGSINRATFLAQETDYVYYMLAIGLGSWFVHFLFFTAWLTFGELQAKSARDRLFHSLLCKEIAWFDMRKNGVGALIPRLQIHIRD